MNVAPANRMLNRLASAKLIVSLARTIRSAAACSGRELCGNQISRMNRQKGQEAQSR
jgi:hypothetical protein